MIKNKSAISKAGSYREMGTYWDTHDLADNWEAGKSAHFEVNIKSEVTYCALKKGLSKRIQKAARHHGISSDTLVNRWIQNKLEEEKV
jgi:hypothetical protein